MQKVYGYSSESDDEDPTNGRANDPPNDDNGTASVSPNGIANDPPNDPANGPASVSPNGTANDPPNGTAATDHPDPIGVTADGMDAAAPNIRPSVSKMFKCVCLNSRLRTL